MKISLFKASLLLCLLCPALLFAQSKAPQLLLASTVDKTIEQISADPKTDADAAVKLLSDWSDYPEVKETGREYSFYYTDATYGTVPLHIYIPPTYKNTQKNACVMMLHGATAISKFSDIDSLANSEEDVLLDALKAQNYIVIRPIADERQKHFSWVVAHSTPNFTYKALNEVLVSLKKVLNIDDNRVYAFGHSDGADGAVGLTVYTPDAFAGIVAYNSMLTNLFAGDFYIRNTRNRPLYIVHSDLDKLRTIKVTREIVDSLKRNNKAIIYKEYAGYQHFDRHLGMDVPYSIEFMKATTRNTFPTAVYWEAGANNLYNTCDWIKIASSDTTIAAAAWNRRLIITERFKWKGEWTSTDHYLGLKKSAAVKATYNNNTFTIQTSSVKEVEVLISPEMVDLTKPVVVIANGKQVFNAKVNADKIFLLNNFQKTMDRQALWVNAIKVKVD